MAFDEKLNDRIREALSDQLDLEEKRMFGGSCFMVNNKMCVEVAGDEMMCRVGAENYEAALTRPGAREMVFTGRPMAGYVFVDQSAIRNEADFRYWIDLCLAFNPKAKASVKKQKD